MSELADSGSQRKWARIGSVLSARRELLRGYLSAVSGSAGRLIFSLVYFIALANTLSIADFGLFATTSAAGVMLSRLLAFGFISPLYRAASVKPRLIGTFTGGFLMMSVASLPVLVIASWLTHAAFFAGDLDLETFAIIVASEVLLWRPFEAVVIVNNGLGQFGRGAMLVIGGTALRALAAAAFAFLSDSSLWNWALLYLAANASILLIAAGFCYPRQRIRIRPALYWRRLRDAVTVSAAEVLFYLQSEFDKLLVLSLGGPNLAGIYAIVMRLVDLTAIPIRAFSMMLVQKLMRAPEMLRGLKVKMGIEAAIFTISTAALIAMAIVLHFAPTALGRNVAEAAPLVSLALLIPGLRNLIEYQAELLYARGQTVLRIVSLLLLTGTKALVLVVLIRASTSAADLIWWLNGGFLLLYTVSTAFTYAALKRGARSF